MTKRASNYKKSVRKIRATQARAAHDLSDTIDKWRDLAYSQRTLLREAADEIERLRAELKAVRGESD